ncbi:MAG: hypothetical protein ACK5LL_16590, partial [Suipraeoptans sp.]
MSKNTKGICKRLLAMVIVVTMISSPINLMSVKADDSDIIAGWSFTEAPELPVSATKGIDESATLDANANGRENVQITTGNGSIYVTGWEEGKYWEFNVSTAERKGITFSAKTQSSNTGPKDWKLSYSIDEGDTWNDIDESNIENANSLVQTYSDFELPSGTFNVQNLKLRLVVNSDTSVNGGSISSTGTSRVADVVIRMSDDTNDDTDDDTDDDADDENSESGDTNINDPISNDMIPDGVLTIGAAYEETSGSEITIIGQIAYAFGNATTHNTYIIQDIIDDEIMGFQIYDSSNSYTVGDIVTVTGTLGAY